MKKYAFGTVFPEGYTVVEGGVTAPQGFLAAAVAAGIKKPGRKDMALLFSKEKAVAAGTFTSNLVKAAPVLWDREIVRGSGSAQAVVMNSGVANACTGQKGLDQCAMSAQAVAEGLGIEPNLVLTASTGVIGRELPMDRMCDGIRTMCGQLSDSLAAGTMAAQAIMTTDTRKKEIAVTLELGGKKVTVGGMSKGAGMIHPNMCTMLAFITTDAAISHDMLQKALSEDVKKTYNMISVDGDTSTNDTCIVLANGMAGNEQIVSAGEDYERFAAALHFVNRYLAVHMAADGEGASTLFEVRIEHAATYEQAAVLAKSIVTSSLVKTAIAGHDANWGRILCAMGYSGAAFEPENVELWFESEAGRIMIAKNGTDAGFDEAEATRILSQDHVIAIADLKDGEESATAWGCDLTHEYISINADYRT